MPTIQLNKPLSLPQKTTIKLSRPLDKFISGFKMGTRGIPLYPTEFLTAPLGGAPLVDLLRQGREALPPRARRAFELGEALPVFPGYSVYEGIKTPAIQKILGQDIDLLQTKSIFEIPAMKERAIKGKKELE